jgi:crotonobetainyl-CoA:carnitine CoA-transferase CaiB-like acyl-CoA transferase
VLRTSDLPNWNATLFEKELDELSTDDTAIPVCRTADDAGRSQPLSRFRVLDLTRVRSGPTAVRQLADWGAEVIKIETPAALGLSDGWGDRRDGADFQNLHRNKQSLTLNLKDAEGIAIFRRLVESADVVVENYRPDVKSRLGIDYLSLKAINRRIILASISGFGQDGPYAARPGFDQIAQGMGGLMGITGEPGGSPMRAGCAVSDSAAGLYCALGIMTALLERERSGEGQWVEVSLLNAMIALLDFQAARWTLEQQVPERTGNDHPTISPTGVFRTADGHINVAAGSDDMFARLCRALGAEHLIAEPAFRDLKSRSRNRVSLNTMLQERLALHDSAYWMARFEALGVAGGPIYTMDQVFADPQVRHNAMAVEVEHPQLGRISLVNQPVRLSRTPHAIRSATPACGAHTDRILHDLGFDEAHIASLRARHVI